MKNAMTEFNRVMDGLQQLMQDEDGDIAIPVLTSYLAACGSFSGKDPAHFKDFVCSAIDRAFIEYKKRKQQ